MVKSQYSHKFVMLYANTPFSIELCNIEIVYHYTIVTAGTANSFKAG